MSDHGPRVLRWPDIVPASRMMAHAYMKRPLPCAGRRTRTVLTWMATVTFALNLALYRPFVPYWIDPQDVRRQTVVAIVPHGRALVPALRGVVPMIVFSAVCLGPLFLIPDPALAQISFGLVGVLATLAVLVLLVPVVASSVVLCMPYKGKIMRRGPKGPRAQLTASFAASTSSHGMLDVRTYLTTHHSGKRLTIRARDNHVRTLYRTLGLKVVTPGRGHMTGIIPSVASR